MTNRPALPPASALSSGPARVISGGQSGVDRAALDAAQVAGVPTGGWCPAGRWAEDGPIPAHYPLVETGSAAPAERTVLNVRDSLATLLLAPAPLVGGTLRTLEAALDLGRPYLVVDPSAPDAAARVRGWWQGVASGGGGCLNVAGPRESEVPGIYVLARALLHDAFAEGPRAERAGAEGRALVGRALAGCRAEREGSDRVQGG